MRKINFKNVIWKEGKYYVAWNLNTAVSSFGKTKKEAMECLREALELHLENVSPSKVNKVESPALAPFALKYA
jgi:predicted RNase H-like HicB family nuclease